MKIKARLNLFFKLLHIGSDVLLISFFAFIAYVSYITFNTPPQVAAVEIADREKVGADHYRIGASWLKKNKYGIWEMYLEGDAFERGVIYGKLSKELCQYQEEVFVEQINDFVPNKFLQFLLKLMIGLAGNDLKSNIPIEYQKEIFGVSKSFTNIFNNIGPKYNRILNYHAAHDIGHALNDYSVVGCTSFAIKGTKTTDGKTLIGRNFDFYVGDKFAENKLILFMNPTNGYAFTSYSWAGFMGVVSGLNEKGISVTINASKSSVPTGMKTPISLLTREILQYAATIEEAIAIAEKRETFVSESLLIGSKNDKRSVIIEKSPNKMGVFTPVGNQLVCSNHFQSKSFINDSINISNIRESDSKYRYDRVCQLLEENEKFSEKQALSILRDQKTNNGDTLGLGNPKAINQLIAHHSVIIRPDDLLFYISTTDYQLGHFVGYNIKDIFQRKQINERLILPTAPFLNTQEYQQFKKFKKMKNNIFRFLNFEDKLVLNENDVTKFISFNSESFLTYELLARYFYKIGETEKANSFINVALTKEVASKKIILELKSLIKEI